MTVELSPVSEELIRNSVQTGAYTSADQFVEEAVRMLSGQERWLDENRDEIRSKIEAGWASAQRGEFLTQSEVEAAMRTHKAQALSSKAE